MTSSTVLAVSLAKPGPRTEEGKRRSASNAFKHGLYSSTLGFSSPEAEAEYHTILQDFENEYRPVLPSDCVLVQQLAALQYRYLKVQASYANILRLSLAEESSNPTLPPLEGPQTANTQETRVFSRLIESSAAFRLYLHELDRLPNRIFRLIERLFRLKTDHRSSSDDAAHYEHYLPALPIHPELISTKSEQKPQIQGTNPPTNAKPLDEKAFLKLWASLNPETRRQLLAEPAQPERKTWLQCHSLDNNTFQRYIRRHTLGA